MNQKLGVGETVGCGSNFCFDWLGDIIVEKIRFDWLDDIVAKKTCFNWLDDVIVKSLLEDTSEAIKCIA